MTDAFNSNITAGPQKTRFLLLLVSLVALIVLEPFIYDYIHINFLVDIFFSIILFTSIYAVSEKKTNAFLAIVLAVPKLATLWALGFTTHPLLWFLDSVFGITFIGYIIVLILNHIFKQKEVTQETIFGAIVVYILLGIIWVFLYSLTETLHPNSFSLTAESVLAYRKALYYFSFITLTTLGYGDITPLSNPAKSLVMLEAIVGQMYIAVLIARLVGIHISQGLMKQ